MALGTPVTQYGTAPHTSDSQYGIARPPTGVTYWGSGPLSPLLLLPGGCQHPEGPRGGGGDITQPPWGWGPPGDPPVPGGGGALGVGRSRAPPPVPLKPPAPHSPCPTAPPKVPPKAVPRHRGTGGFLWGCRGLLRGCRGQPHNTGGATLNPAEAATCRRAQVPGATRGTVTPPSPLIPPRAPQSRAAPSTHPPWGDKGDKLAVLGGGCFEGGARWPRAPVAGLPAVPCGGATCRRLRARGFIFTPGPPGLFTSLHLFQEKALDTPGGGTHTHTEGGGTFSFSLCAPLFAPSWVLEAQWGEDPPSSGWVLGAHRVWTPPKVLQPQLPTPPNPPRPAVGSPWGFGVPMGSRTRSVARCHRGHLVPQFPPPAIRCGAAGRGRLGVPSGTRGGVPQP